MRALAVAVCLLVVVLTVSGCHKLLGDYTIDPGCQPGATRCVGNVRQACNPQGNAWDNLEVCDSAALCAPDQPKCLSSVCVPGERRCRGADLLLCNPARDGWVVLQTCATPGRCSGERDQGRCTDEPCSPGELECNGSELRSCLADGSDWKPRQDCGSPALCIEATHACEDAKCQPGQFRCAGAELQVCNAMLTGWNPVRTCESSALCNDVNGDCGTVACTVANTFSCDGAILQRCSDDLTALVDEKECASAALCDAVNGRCSDSPCAPGTRQCSGATLMVCREDQSGWDPVETCVSDALCQQTVSAAAPNCLAPVCDEKATRCVGAQPEVCNAGRSGFRPNGSPCATPELCAGGSGTCGMPVCKPGEPGCDGAQPTICNQGLTSPIPNGPPCASDALCNRDLGTCGDQKCAAGQLRCDPAAPTHLQRCRDDLTGWEETPCDICATAELCAASLGATTCDASSCQEPVCAAGVPHCGGSGPDQGKVLEMCNSGRTGYTSCQTCETARLCEVSLTTTPFKCTAQACTAPSCALTDRWCGGSSGRQLFQCPASRINSEAQVIATCETAGLCQLTHQNNKTTCEAPSCALTDRWCGGTGGKSLYQCPASRINSQATLLDTCVTAGLCQLTHTNNKTTCEAPKCMPGDTNCGGTGGRKLQMCNSDLTGFNDCATCASAQLCMDSLGATSCDSTACLVCSVGDASCNANGDYETCATDQKGFDVTDCMGNGCDETMGGCLPAPGP